MARPGEIPRRKKTAKVVQKAKVTKQEKKEQEDSIRYTQKLQEHGLFDRFPVLPGEAASPSRRKEKPDILNKFTESLNPTMHTKIDEALDEELVQYGVKVSEIEY